MIAVLDASAAVGVVLLQPAAMSLIQSLESATLVLTPDLFVSEVCNALWKYRKAELLTREETDLALSRALALPDRFEPAFACYQEAFAIAERYQHPFYDALYLVIARRNNAQLLTLDKRLVALAVRLDVAVM